jgi:hypothetical protein
MTTKFFVQVSRHGVFKYVQRIDHTPVTMTTNRKLAMPMGRLTAEDTVRSIQTSKCIPEILSVHSR